jgi:hypothetical protein
MFLITKSLDRLRGGKLSDVDKAFIDEYCRMPHYTTEVDLAKGLMESMHISDNLSMRWCVFNRGWDAREALLNGCPK